MLFNLQKKRKKKPLKAFICVIKLDTAIRSKRRTRFDLNLFFWKIRIYENSSVSVRGCTCFARDATAATTRRRGSRPVGGEPAPSHFARATENSPGYCACSCWVCCSGASCTRCQETRPPPAASFSAWQPSPQPRISADGCSP